MTAAVTLDDVLAHPALLSLEYQPIVDLARAELVGYEALARLPGDAAPPTWFELAEARGRGTDLQLLVLDRVVERMPAVPRGRFLAVNLSVAAVADARVAALVARAGSAASRLVLELTDRLPLDDVSTLLTAVEPLREHGVQIAVHVGPAEQSLPALRQLRPDVVKLRSSVDGPDGGGVAGDLESDVEQYGDELGAAVVVTVLEAAQDLQTVNGARAPLAQGYVLGRPDVVMTELSTEVLELLRAPSGGRLPAALTVRRTPGENTVTAPLDGRQVVGVLSSTSLVQLLEGLSGR